MKKKIRFLIFVLLILIIVLLFIINKQGKKEEQEVYGDSEFKNYKEEYVEQKKKYGCNEFSLINISTDDLLKMYFNKYKNSILENPEDAFNMLDKEYREKRFGNIEKFKEYITKNYNLIVGTELSSYIADNYDNYTQYVCKDNKGNYYIFRETAVMEYSMLLDTYTIDLPEFAQKYYSATQQQKVALNIEKFIQAINEENYYYAYNCLADSYKNNNFTTQEEFEIYAKEVFYGSDIEYKVFNTEGEVYTYSVVLTNRNTQEQTNKTFIMQLGERTEFVMSFNK